MQASTGRFGDGRKPVITHRRGLSWPKFGVAPPLAQETVVRAEWPDLADEQCRSGVDRPKWTFLGKGGGAVRLLRRAHFFSASLAPRHGRETGYIRS